MNLASPSLSNSSAKTDPSLDAMLGWRDRRDQTAAMRLVRELSPQMHRVALRSLPVAWMAEDAVQTAWMKLFRSLDSFDPRVPVSAWALMIVNRVCWNLRRGLQRQRMVAWDDLPEPEIELAVATLPTEERPDHREMLRQVMAEVARLSHTDRLIVNSFLLDDQPAAEVARRTGLNVGAVRTRACRLRTRLRCA